MTSGGKGKPRYAYSFLMWSGYIGPFNSIKDALQAATKDYFDGQDREEDSIYTCFIGEIVQFSPRINIEQVIKQVREQAYLECDEMVDNDYLRHLKKDEIKSLGRQLDNVFKRWAYKHEHKPKFFSITNVLEYEI